MVGDGPSYIRRVCHNSQDADLEMGGYKKYKYTVPCDLRGQNPIKQRGSIYDSFGNINTNKMVNYINQNNIIPIKWYK
ncbi:MAG: hypothetical protein V1914_02435 [archaeon]